jgi:hypothetical protein
MTNRGCQVCGKTGIDGQMPGAAPAATLRKLAESKPEAGGGLSSPGQGRGVNRGQREDGGGSIRHRSCLVVGHCVAQARRATAQKPLKSAASIQRWDRRANCAYAVPAAWPIRVFAFIAPVFRLPLGIFPPTSSPLDGSPGSVGWLRDPAADRRRYPLYVERAFRAGDESGAAGGIDSPTHAGTRCVDPGDVYSVAAAGVRRDGASFA